MNPEPEINSHPPPSHANFIQEDFEPLLTNKVVPPLIPLENKPNPLSPSKEPKVLPFLLYDEFEKKCKLKNPHYYLCSGDSFNSLSYSTFEEIDVASIPIHIEAKYGSIAYKKYEESLNKSNGDMSFTWLRFYTHESDFWKFINEALRNFDESAIELYSREIKALRLAFRYTDPPKKAITLYRGIDLNKEQQEKLKNNLKMPVILPGFISTSFGGVPDFFKKYNCVFEIRYTPTQSNFPELDEVFPVNLVKYSSHPQENEYLFPCFQSFRILEVSRKNGKDLWVKMEHCPLHFYMNIPRFLWFDPSFGENENEFERQEIKKYLNSIPENEKKDEKMFFTDLEGLVQRVEELKRNRLIGTIITCGSKAEEMLAKIDQLTPKKGIQENKTIKSIIIFCFKPEKYHHLFRKYPKITTITRNFGDIKDLVILSQSLFKNNVKTNLKSIFNETFAETLRIIRATIAYYREQIFNVIRGHEHNAKTRERVKMHIMRLEQSLASRLTSTIHLLEGKVSLTMKYINIRVELKNKEKWRSEQTVARLFGKASAMSVANLMQTTTTTVMVSPAFYTSGIIHGHYVHSAIQQQAFTFTTVHHNAGHPLVTIILCVTCLVIMGLCWCGHEIHKSMQIDQYLMKLDREFGKIQKSIEVQMANSLKDLKKRIDELLD